MDNLKWIESTGGPLVLIADKSYQLWSGTLKRVSYLENRFEHADDFMDPDESDYGKACGVQDYLGVVDIGNDFALILGDEPLLTTTLETRDGHFIIARWIYADDKFFVEQNLQALNVDDINTWEMSLMFRLSSDTQFLFDSSLHSGMLDKGESNYLSLSIPTGLNKIWTSIYKPDSKTKLLIHKFERINGLD